MARVAERITAGVLSGAAGTAVLSLAYAGERRIRRTRTGPLDYDDGSVPGWIVLHVLRLHDTGAVEETRAGLALRWSYGCGFGLAHSALRTRLPEPAATVAFGAVLIAATFSLFPLLGRTPPPWRWRPDVLATSLATHALYATAVGLAGSVPGLRPRRRRPAREPAA